jgi:hypothetical protein
MKSIILLALLAVFTLSGCHTGSCCYPRDNTPEPEKPKPQQQARLVLPKAVPSSQPSAGPARTGPVYGHGENYEWLVGTLQRVHTPGGEWKVRYAPLYEQDRWGGSVILAPDIRLETYEDGEFVHVVGEIVNSRPTLYLSGPLYRIHSIERTSVQEDRIARGD